MNNVSKKTFLPKLSNSVFFPETLSLKKLLQQELLETITQDQFFKIEVNNWKQLDTYLSEKTILCPFLNLDFRIGYRCAISFYLSKLVSFPPLLVAKKLSLLLVSPKKRSSIISSLNLEVSISEPGYIDFYLCNHNIYLWLDYLVLSISNYPFPQLITFSQKDNQQLDFLFPLYYIYKRCCSLLSVGIQENLINLKARNSQNLDWAISQPSNFYDFSFQQKSDIATIEAIQLSWQVLWLIDLLLNNENYFRKNQDFLLKNTCQIWTQFISNCRFCGEIKEQSKDLAKIRLGLIALYAWCLKMLLSRANFDLNNLS